MKVVVSVGVLGWAVGQRVKLHHGLHGQRTVDEVGRLVVDVLHLDDDPLVVSI